MGRAAGPGSPLLPPQPPAPASSSRARAATWSRQPLCSRRSARRRWRLWGVTTGEGWREGGGGGRCVYVREGQWHASLFSRCASSRAKPPVRPRACAHVHAPITVAAGDELQGEFRARERVERALSGRERESNKPAVCARPLAVVPLASTQAPARPTAPTTRLFLNDGVEYWFDRRGGRRWRWAGRARRHVKKGGKGSEKGRTAAKRKFLLLCKRDDGLPPAQAIAGRSKREHTRAPRRLS